MASFAVYVGLAGNVSQEWHSDCSSQGQLTSVDVGGDTSSMVFFHVQNTGRLPITDRFRKDCSGYPTGICSSGPHLHQAPSSGKENDCLEADLDDNCQAKAMYDLPTLHKALPAYTSDSTILYSA